MEKYMDHSNKEQKRKSKINYLSDDKKVKVKRNLINTEKCKRYIEMKKNEALFLFGALPISSVDPIENKREEKKQRNREKTKRYREKKKNEIAAGIISHPYDSYDKEREEERKQKNREKTRRYREKKKNEGPVVTISHPFDPYEKEREEKRKQKNREKTRRFREKKKIEFAALSMATDDSSGTKMEQARQKQSNAERCKRYRDKKRTSKQMQNISNHKNVPQQIDSSQIVNPPSFVPPVLQSSTIPGPSRVPFIPPSHSNSSSHIRSIEDTVIQSDIGDICVCPCHSENGQLIVMVAVYISPDKSLSAIQEFLYENLFIYSKDASELLQDEFGKRFDDLPMILNGYFNVNFADDKNLPLIKFLISEFDLTMSNDSNISTARLNTENEAVFTRYLDKLESKLLVSSFS